VRGISAADLAAHLESQRPVVLDVGTSLQHEARHVPGARWISRGWLELRIAEVAKNREHRIVVTSPTDEHSTLAAATLMALGYRNVAVLEGGTRAWADAGHPTEKGLAAPIAEPNDVPLRGLLKGDREAMLAYLRWEVQLAGESRGA
jgi:rhodanese-related sulfurtransferase